MKKVAQEVTRRSNHKRGRTSNDQKSLDQSIVMGTLPTRGANQDNGTAKRLSKVHMTSLLGLNRHSCKRIVDAVQSKQEALELGDVNSGVPVHNRNEPLGSKWTHYQWHSIPMTLETVLTCL
eukprot:CAMPEP_0201274082 /NCGR_PEP_ID=MMETSP0853-20130426/47594_1 /ASSEMBLY_ACC=CAM_ASM_000640 /TAXON_ID=183588 /ORGANISM="Pseudo-nitzschia fraudulenta, Strain WWA7" /LENGTH=121 /DNA_ID=CAMNT_0047581357 /DNA_START=158 /DNA_END=523 /DNA_ORIENTATION=+